MFEEKDLENVLELDRIYPPTARDPIGRETALDLYNQNSNACLVAEEDKLIGFAFCEIKEGACRIRFMQVSPDRLGEGTVQKLIDKIVELNKPRSLSFSSVFH